MGKTVDQFFTENEGKPLDFDGFYGRQCMDCAQFYNRDVVGAPVLKGNAIDVWSVYPQDFYTKVINNWNDLNQFPVKGDLILWNAGKFGHIAICSQADGRAFTSFEINWPIQGYTDSQGNFIGTGVAHFQNHDYAGVLGWLHPKVAVNGQTQVQNAPVPPTPPQPVLMTVIADLGANIRPTPTLTSKPITAVKKGTQLAFAAIVQGDMYNQNNVWYKLTNGYYVWSGAVAIQPQGGK